MEERRGNLDDKKICVSEAPIPFSALAPVDPAEYFFSSLPLIRRQPPSAAKDGGTCCNFSVTDLGLIFPYDVLKNIFFQLDKGQLMRCRRVCKLWKRLAEEVLAQLYAIEFHQTHLFPNLLRKIVASFLQCYPGYIERESLQEGIKQFGMQHPLLPNPPIHQPPPPPHQQQPPPPLYLNFSVHALHRINAGRRVHQL
jgi:hypothetical protein